MTDDSDVSVFVRIWLVLCGLMFLVSAPVSGIFLAKLYREAQASANWPSVQGKITRAEVQETRLGLTRKFTTDVKYTYVVEGRAYSGTHIRPSDKVWEDRLPALNALKGLATGRQVRVFYKPDEPAQSLLQPGTELSDKAILVIPFFLLAIGVGALVLPYLSMRRG